MTTARKKAFETAKTTETAGTAGTNKNNESGKYLKTNLAQVTYIWYPIIFRKKFVLILFDLNNEINIIYLTFTKKLGLSIIPIDIGAQKIDNTILDTYKIIVAAFSMTNKANQ